MPQVKPEKAYQIEYEPVSKETLQKLKEWELARKKLIDMNLAYNPAATNYSMSVGALHGPLGALTNAPNTLTVEAHGAQYEPQYYVDRNSPAYGQAMVQQGARDAVRLQPGPVYNYIPNGNEYGDFSMRELAQAIGPGTNQIRHVVNSACYGGDCRTFDEAKKYFPNLESLVGPSNKQMSAGDLRVLEGTEKWDSAGKDFYQRHDFSPLYEYKQNSTNQVYQMLDWLKDTLSKTNVVK